MSATPPFAIGVDIGGTFTDAVAIDAGGETQIAKAPTTPDDFSVGVIDALAVLAGQLGTDLPALLAATKTIKHGSTVATNALITRSGVRVGLIMTRGFEDTPLIMRAVGRVDGLPEEEVRQITRVVKPEPLVDPTLIRGVSERIGPDGTVIVPLDLDEARRVIAELLDAGAQAIAVSLLHAWREPAHERAIEQLVREASPDGAITCSLGGDLSRIAGEYARTNTAIADAFIGPAVRGYLANLHTRLRADGFAGRIFVMQGNGGLTSHEAATAISTLQSGPAGGILGSAYLGERMDHRRIITTDMGGTSFDVGTIDGTYWRYAEEPVFERFRIVQPITDITSIGAGGGTIARVDPDTGRLLVGPQSAGAKPGPACYGAGGIDATVTDCDLILGYIDADHFLGGRRSLDLELAREAVRTRLAAPLGIGVDEAAAGVVRIIDSRMADLIRREVIKSGRSPADFVVYAFGGAGPVHAVGYAQDLGVSSVVVSPLSPVLSAFGIASAGLVHSRVVTRSYALPIDAEVLDGDLAYLESELTEELVRTGSDAPEFRRYATLRFRRQTTGEEIAIPWDRFSEARVEQLAALFVAHVDNLYGTAVAYAGAGIDIIALRVDAVAAVDRPPLRSYPAAADGGSVDAIERRPAWFGSGFLDTPVYASDHLTPGTRLVGPAIVRSPLTTTVLPPTSSLEVDSFLNLVIRP